MGLDYRPADPGEAVDTQVFRLVKGFVGIWIQARDLVQDARTLVVKHGRAAVLAAIGNLPAQPGRPKPSAAEIVSTFNDLRAFVLAHSATETTETLPDLPTA